MIARVGQMILVLSLLGVLWLLVLSLYATTPSPLNYLLITAAAGITLWLVGADSV